MLQPDVASVLLTDRLLADRGLLSRLLVAAPEPTSGTRYWRDPKPESQRAIERYRERLLKILETAPLLADGKPNELVPRRLSLSSEADQGWIAFVDHVESQIGPGGDMEPIRGLANKLPEHAARLAGVLALVDDLGVSAVTANYFRSGIQLAEHYASDALRLFSAGRMDPHLRLAKRTLAWLCEKWPHEHVGLSDLYRLGPNPVRDSKTARRMTSILADHGWLVPTEGGAEIDGQHRRETWRVVRW